MKIHLQTLIDKGACRDQVDLFRAMFGKAVNVTEELCVSVADKFNLDWAATHLLTSQALAEYNRIKAAAWDDYRRTLAAASADYMRKVSALADYERIAASAWADYERAQARAFANVYTV